MTTLQTKNQPNDEYLLRARSNLAFTRIRVTQFCTMMKIENSEMSIKSFIQLLDDLESCPSDFEDYVQNQPC